MDDYKWLNLAKQKATSYEKRAERERLLKTACEPRAFWELPTPTLPRLHLWLRRPYGEQQDARGRRLRFYRHEECH